MKSLKQYTYEEAVTKISSDSELKILYNKLKLMFDYEGPNFDYGTDYVDCVVCEDYDEDTDVETLTLVVSAVNQEWNADTDDIENAYTVSVEVPTIEQAVCIIKDIEDAKGNIK